MKISSFTTLFMTILFAHLAYADVDVKTFKTPSKNIFCMGYTPDIGDQRGIAQIRCDIINYSYSDGPKPNDCEFDWGHGFAISSKGNKGERICTSDTISNDQYKVLNYNQTWRYHQLTCSLNQTGLKCTNQKKHGFFLSKDKFKLF